MSLDLYYQAILEPKITIGSAVFKLLLSMVAGAAVGLNRERHKQPAGLRTHILICIGSALLMMLSIYIPQTYFDFKNGDPGRIAAQVVSGIGFLGAGAIIRLGNNVRGLTTAASIWLVSAVGLTIGAGLYIISLVTVLIAIFTLVILENIEKKFFPHVFMKTLVLSFENQHLHSEEVKKILRKQKIHFQIIDFTTSSNTLQSSEIKFLVKIPEHIDLDHFLYSFQQVKDLKNVEVS